MGAFLEWITRKIRQAVSKAVNIIKKILKQISLVNRICDALKRTKFVKTIKKKSYNNNKSRSKFSNARIGHSMDVRRSNTIKVLRKYRDSLHRKKKQNLKKIG